MNRWHTNRKPIKKFNRFTVGGLVLAYIMLWIFMIMHTCNKNIEAAYLPTQYTTGGNTLIYAIAAIGGLAALAGGWKCAGRADPFRNR